MSNNNNTLHTEAVAHPQWSSFSCSNMLKTDLPVCEMGPSYLLDLSTGLKYTEVRVMAANNCSEETDCVGSEILTSCLTLWCSTKKRRRQSVFFKEALHQFYTRPQFRVLLWKQLCNVCCASLGSFSQFQKKKQLSSFRQLYLGLRLALMFQRIRVNVCQIGRRFMCSVSEGASQCLINCLNHQQSGPRMIGRISGI